MAALARQDVQRFTRLLLLPEELRSLGLGRAKTDALAAKIAKAEGDFKALLAGRTASRQRPSGCSSAAASPASCRPTPTVPPGLARL